MVPTAVSAVFAQYRKQALHFEWVRLLAPGVAFGSALGSKLAGAVSGPWIAVIFGAYASFFALKLISQGKRTTTPAQAKSPVACRISALPQWSVGVFIGGFSSLAGVGGASLVVPYLLSRDAGMRHCWLFHDRQRLFIS